VAGDNRRKKKNLKNVNEYPFEVSSLKHGTAATLWLAPGFQTCVICLATLWAPSVKKWNLYKEGKKIC